MTTTLKRPPVLPSTLPRFIGYGLAFCVVVPVTLSLGHLLLSNLDLIAKRNPGVLFEQALRLSLIATGAVAGLWVAAYWSCWPYLFWSYVQARHAAEKKEQAAAAERSLARKREQIAKDEAQRRAQFEAIETQRRQQARHILTARLQEIEKQILLAYAQHAVRMDFFGDKPEVERLKPFADRLRSLGIHDIGVLHYSAHPTVKKLLACAPAVPMVNLENYLPHRPSGELISTPLYTPAYDPFKYAVYTQPKQSLKQRFRDKLFALRLPLRFPPRSSRSFIDRAPRLD